MFTKSFRAAAGIAAAGALVTGCSNPSSSASDSGPDSTPAVLASVTGSSVQKVTLSEHAMLRLKIATQPVQAGTTPATVREAIPYAAVVYDHDGSSWAYTSVGERAFQRAPITIVAIQGDQALLSAGPAVGTPVVTVGAPELLGAEYNISGEE